MKEAIGGVGIEEGARRMSRRPRRRKEGRGSGGSKNKSMLKSDVGDEEIVWWDRLMTAHSLEIMLQ